MHVLIDIFALLLSHFSKKKLRESRGITLDVKKIKPEYLNCTYFKVFSMK